MDTPLIVTLASFIGVLLFLVVIHELGHFITAKLAGVTVQEFGIGYPPRLFAVRFRGTEYSLNLLPLGGFVKLLGEEDPNETARRQEGVGALVPGGAAVGNVETGRPEVTLASRPIPVRIIILAAGGLMNALLPVVLFTASLMLPQDVVTGHVVVQDVAPGSPAALAGVRPGDQIIRINDRPIDRIQDVGYNIQLNLGNEIEMRVRHAEGDFAVLRMVPRWNPPEGQGATGIVIGMPEATRRVETQALPIWEALPKATQQSFDMLTLFKNGVISMFVNSNPQARQVAGPVGIAQMTGEVAKAGLPPLLEWAAFLSMNLAIFNLLPIPMLDGGRIFFVLLEAARGGKRIPPEREGLVHLVGFALLMTFVVIVSINDILRIINGESFFR